MNTNVQEGYNQWAAAYDTVLNKTRDLDAVATQNVLATLPYHNVLELGCGTGKNTQWLLQKAQHITAVDFSAAMLQQAQQKITAANVQFVQADITKPWPFADTTFDLLTCNLILEHIQNLPFVFSEAYRVLQAGGYFFVCELHPARQYAGSKARFEKGADTFVLDCFVHHTSDFFTAATTNGFRCTGLHEWFDDEANTTPRLISFLFQKP